MNEKEILYSQFDSFPKVFIEKYFPELLLENSDIIKDIEKKISDYYRPTLIYLINEKRIEESLVGSSSAVSYTHLSQEQLQELSKGVSELITGVEKDFQVEVNRLKEFYGSH